MQSPEWLLPWWEVYGGGRRELCVLALRDDGGDLAGLAPWYIDCERGRRVLRWLGDGAACSDHATLLHRPDQSLAVVDATARWMAESSAELWRHASLESVDDDDLTCREFFQRLQAQGMLISRSAAPASCFIDLPEDWDAYLAGLSKNHRKRCRRWVRDYFDSGRVQVAAAETAAEARSAWGALMQLHGERRRSLGEAGGFEDVDFAAFHEAAIASLAAAGKLQLRILRRGREPLAAEYVLQTDDAVFAYQSGLSAAGERISAGSLSLLATIRDAIATGRRRVDLLRGEEAYKQRWGAVRRPASTLVIRRRTALGRAAAWGDAAWEAVRQVKQEVEALATLVPTS